MSYFLDKVFRVFMVYLIIICCIMICVAFPSAVYIFYTDNGLLAGLISGLIILPTGIMTILMLGDIAKDLIWGD